MTPTEFPPFLAPLLDECVTLLEQTDRAALQKGFRHNGQRDDVLLHFYELFLAAYNPRMRGMRGVYYTPQAVVSYMVRSVDSLLQSHLRRPEGLGDDQVIVLDPAVGTATFLHAIIQHISTRMGNSEGDNDSDNDGEAGSPGSRHDEVAATMLPRIMGYEMLPAPRAIAHLKLKLLLEEMGAAAEVNPTIFLGNVLAQRFQCPMLNGEAPTLVIIGNPPYATTSANKGLWEEEIRARYYPRDSIREQNPKLLLDDYVKFIAFGQWHIEQAGAGILAFVTNHSYLDNPTFRGMRQSLLHTFTDIYILNLHGNARQRELAPDGSTDENVFDIQQGVVVGLFVKRPHQHHTAGGPAHVSYAELWGPRTATHSNASDNKPNSSSGGKYEWLATHDVQTTTWVPLHPQPPFSLFVPHNTALLPEYERGWRVTDMMPLHSSGIKTHRDHFVFDFERQVLEQRIGEFRDTAIDDATIRERYALPNTRDWNLAQKRHALSRDETWQHHFQPCLYRPFDTRTLYYHPHVVERSLQRVMCHMLAGDNIGLITVRQVAEPAFTHVLVTDCIAECRATLSNKGAGYLFPLYCEDGEQQRQPNFAPTFLAALEERWGVRFVPSGSGDFRSTIGAEDVFHYICAVLHSPTYRQRYAPFLKLDFPRIPLPHDATLAARLAACGAALVDLHLLRLPGSTGRGRAGGAGGAAVLVNPTQSGVSFPQGGSGRVEQVVYMPASQHKPGCVFINHEQYIAGVPAQVWEMQVGGYQPLAKWLKMRKGRCLSEADVLHAMRMVVALREMQGVMAAIEQHIPEVLS
jgi:predicted helicase